MLNTIQQLGQIGIQRCQRLGQSGLFLSRVLLRNPRLTKTWPLLVNEIYYLGVLSLVIVMIAGLFIGLVVGLQGQITLSQFGAEQSLGQLVALSIVRELGPVVTALLFAGRAGTALTAEIGLMKTTEQLDSLDMMGVDPLWRVIWPRFWAGCIAMPVLTLLFSAVAILGGYLIGVAWLGVDEGAFWANMQANVSFRIDILHGIIKSLVFGMVVTWIAVYQGYYTECTAQGISRATTYTVVYASLAVLGLDFILTATMLGGH